ncbi:hypothetical protein LJC59_02285 [Desulfovibrio sp. OttesenSCG-928-A18]|nr:hypothetical protein [Desulfovibrio sp. OttesenSCG-928-A18]
MKKIHIITYVGICLLTLASLGCVSELVYTVTPEAYVRLERQNTSKFSLGNKGMRAVDLEPDGGPTGLNRIKVVFPVDMPEEEARFHVNLYKQIIKDEEEQAKEDPFSGGDGSGGGGGC